MTGLFTKIVTLRPRIHQLLLGTVGDESWIADVGFGRNSLRAPLRLTQTWSIRKALTLYASGARLDRRFPC